MTYFFPLSDRWVAFFFCVEVQSLIDPVEKAWVLCAAGGESPQTARGLFRACVYFNQPACGLLRVEILNLPFKAKIGTNYSVGT